MLFLSVPVTFSHTLAYTFYCFMRCINKNVKLLQKILFSHLVVINIVLTNVEINLKTTALLVCKELLISKKECTYHIPWRFPYKTRMCSFTRYCKDIIQLT